MGGRGLGGQPGRTARAGVLASGAGDWALSAAPTRARRGRGAPSGGMDAMQE
jgi:hypothetical protein